MSDEPIALSIAPVDLGFLSLPWEVRAAVDEHAARRLAEQHPCQAFVPADTPRAIAAQRAPAGMGVCYRRDVDKPLCFRGEPWCCDNHRKLVVAQQEATP